MSIEMETVADAVMDMQAVLLGNKTNVDELVMRSIKGQYGLQPLSPFVYSSRSTSR